MKIWSFTNGWRMPRRDRRWGLLIAALWFALPLVAEEELEVSPEFLEFLGEWEGADGSWQDPFALQDGEPAEPAEEEDDEQ